MEEVIGFGIAGACGVPHSSFAPIQTCNPLQHFERGVAQGVLPTTWAVRADNVSSFSSVGALIHVPCSCDRRSGEGSDNLATLRSSLSGVASPRPALPPSAACSKKCHICPLTPPCDFSRLPRFACLAPRPDRNRLQGLRPWTASPRPKQPFFRPAPQTPKSPPTHSQLRTAHP